MTADLVMKDHSPSKVLYLDAVVVKLIDAGISGELEGDLDGVLLAHRVDHHASFGVSGYGH